MKLLTLELAKGRFLWAHGGIQLTQVNNKISGLREDSVHPDTLQAIEYARSTNQLLVTEEIIEDKNYVEPLPEEAEELTETLDMKGLKALLRLTAPKISNQLLRLRKLSKNYMLDILYLIEEERTHKNRKAVHEILQREFSVSKGLSKGLAAHFVSEVIDDPEDQEVVTLSIET